MKLSDYVIARVAQEVKHIFLLPGGGCMHLVDSVGRNRDLEFVCNLHEQASAIAAEAYGQYTNHLGAALVTTGPGGTNAVTGVAGAWLDSTPCLFLSGQVKRADLATGRGVRQMGFQEIGIVEIVRSITKYAVTVTEPRTIRYHLEKALHLARSGRPGPVWLDIPLDVQAAEIDGEALPTFDPREVGAAAPDRLAEQVRQAIELLNQAERPVILVGNGVRLARAQRMAADPGADDLEGARPAAGRSSAVRGAAGGGGTARRQLRAAERRLRFDGGSAPRSGADRLQPCQLRARSAQSDGRHRCG